MSTVNDFSGNYFLTPDLPAGYGQSISNPAAILNNMITHGLYFQEMAGDLDVVLINVEGYLVSMYKTLSNQRFNATVRCSFDVHIVAKQGALGA